MNSAACFRVARFVVALTLGAVASASIVDLGDITVGGNGAGSGPVGAGLSTGNGTIYDAHTYAGNSYGPFQFIRTDGSGGTANLPYVDGVFVPHGTSQITSAGLQFPFPDTNGKRWDAIRNAAAFVHSDTHVLYPIQLPDQPGVDRRGIGIHANNGITYDLARLRNDGYVFDAVSGIAGINYDALNDPSPSIETWIIVDGQVLFDQPFRTIGGLTYRPFNLTLPSNAQRLTVVVTDLNENTDADHGVIADFALVPEPAALLLVAVGLAAARRR